MAVFTVRLPPPCNTLVITVRLSTVTEESTFTMNPLLFTGTMMAVSPMPGTLLDGDQFWTLDQS
jgi:hypothetical protein